MDSAPNSEKTLKSGLFRNWLSLAGWVTVVASFFAFLLLFITDLFAGRSNPYVGVLTYLVAPAFTVLGLCLIGLGVWLRRRSGPGAEGGRFSFVVDFSQPRDRRRLGYFVAASVIFLFITALGSYHSYQFTESNSFCGEACHTVMKPEHVTYQHSPHARVSCVECHIGRGATWWVKSKLSGAYQVYATLADKYPRPIPTPIKDLRPAQDTCEHCHWPQKFSGNVVRTYSHYLSDETNTHYAVRMLLKVGGGDPTRGPVGGIHWHMSVANTVEYIASDHGRQDIPWVRLTDKDGKVTVFKTKEFTNAVDPEAIRKMDCMDCHNRPAHIYRKPNDAVDLAMDLGRIDRALPYVRSNATALLVQPYASEAEARQTIAAAMAKVYPGDARATAATAEIQRIYRTSFFPEMKASWKAYPENIGHKDWPGCVRCHDDKHVAEDGKRVVSFKDCNACHLIIAQGSGADLEKLTPSGQAFAHPAEEYDPDFKCNDCHSGGP